VRVLGIDLGGSRTGLALSDPLGLTCSPLDVVAERDEERLLLRIVAEVKEQDVGEIVVGLPRPLAGGTNRQVESAFAFAKRLERQSGVPVVTWDERFTSKLAERGRSRVKAQDAVAACYMLQSYLDSRTNTRGDA
jgi:putative Holliday junction resolvase